MMNFDNYIDFKDAISKIDYSTLSGREEDYPTFTADTYEKLSEIMVQNDGNLKFATKSLMLLNKKVRQYNVRGVFKGLYITCEDNYYIMNTRDRKICCTCCAPIDVDYDFYIRKFRNRFGMIEWNDGNCYWGATILEKRFGGDMYYDVSVGHFVVKMSDGRFYDFDGEYTPQDTKYMIEWEKFSEYDSLQCERIMRDCVLNY